MPKSVTTGPSTEPGGGASVSGKSTASNSGTILPARSPRTSQGRHPALSKSTTCYLSKYGAEPVGLLLHLLAKLAHLSHNAIQVIVDLGQMCEARIVFLELLVLECFGDLVEEAHASRGSSADTVACRGRPAACRRGLQGE